MSVKRVSPVAERYKPWTASWRLEKYASETDARPYEVKEFQENVALNVGKAEIWNLVIGDSANVFDNTNAYLGVGDSSTAAAAAQTDLQAAVNTTYVQCDAGYPKRDTTTTTNDTLVARATFGSADGNHGWKEYVVKNDASGICLNRKVEDNGTKTVGEVWILTVSIAAS